MALSVTETDLKTLLAAAADAVGSGDFATARTKLAQARLLRARLPRSLASSGDTVSYDEIANIEEALDKAERAAAVAGGQFARVTRGRPV